MLQSKQGPPSSRGHSQAAEHVALHNCCMSQGVSTPSPLSPSQGAVLEKMRQFSMLSLDKCCGMHQESSASRPALIGTDGAREGTCCGALLMYDEIHRSHQQSETVDTKWLAETGLPVHTTWHARPDICPLIMHDTAKLM